MADCLTNVRHTEYLQPTGKPSGCRWRHAKGLRVKHGGTQLTSQQLRNKLRKENRTQWLAASGQNRRADPTQEFSKRNHAKRVAKRERDRNTRSFDMTGWQVRDNELEYLTDFEWEGVEVTRRRVRGVPMPGALIALSPYGIMYVRPEDVVGGRDGKKARHLIDHEEAARECGWQRPVKTNYRHRTLKEDESARKDKADEEFRFLTAQDGQLAARWLG